MRASIATHHALLDGVGRRTASVPLAGFESRLHPPLGVADQLGQHSGQAYPRRYPECRNGRLAASPRQYSPPTTRFRPRQGQGFFHRDTRDATKYLSVEGFDISEVGLLKHLREMTLATEEALTSGSTGRA